MKAAIYARYGGPEVVSVAEVDDPVCGDEQILVEVLATTVSAADRRIRAASFPRGMAIFARLVFGAFRPRKPVLGTELAGRVVKVGAKVTRWKVGDEVIAQTGARLGAHAELVVLREDSAMTRRPEGLDVVSAAALAFGGTTALYFLRDLGGLRPGQRVLVLGGAGVVGSAAIQLARHLGAHVDATCSSGQGERVFEPTRDPGLDFGQLDPAYDLIVDTADITTLRACRKALTRDGRLLMVAADLPAMLRMVLNPFRKQKALAGVVPERATDLAHLAELAAKGHYRPAIDSVFPLAEITAAHTRAETRGRVGSVVVQLG
ncbi:MAG TPA: NAD(P)-dependent alcohol dehydrogenase [Myxococcota bacterium]|nr:NAD(P)-dependent alcohol dehydrogenase [Myxococcota bacterium]